MYSKPTKYRDQKIQFLFLIEIDLPLVYEYWCTLQACVVFLSKSLSLRTTTSIITRSFHCIQDLKGKVGFMRVFFFLTFRNYLNYQHHCGVKEARGAHWDARHLGCSRPVRGRPQVKIPLMTRKSLSDHDVWVRGMACCLSLLNHGEPNRPCACELMYTE